MTEQEGNGPIELACCKGLQYITVIHSQYVTKIHVRRNSRKSLPKFALRLSLTTH